MYHPALQLVAGCELVELFRVLWLISLLSILLQPFFVLFLFIYLPFPFSYS